MKPGRLSNRRISSIIRALTRLTTSAQLSLDSDKHIQQGSRGFGKSDENASRKQAPEMSKQQRSDSG